MDVPGANILIGGYKPSIAGRVEKIQHDGTQLAQDNEASSRNSIGEYLWKIKFSPTHISVF